MQSSLIGKIEKAKRYAQEIDRVTFSELSVKFRGENDTYTTAYKAGSGIAPATFSQAGGLAAILWH